MTAVSDALIYSSPLLGEMDFLGDCTDWCTLKMASEASRSLVRVHTWLLHFDLFIYLSQYVCKSSCIVGFLLCKPRLLEHHVYFFLSLEKKHKTEKRKKKDITRFKLLPQLWLLLSSACSESFLWYSVHDMKSLQTSNKPPHVLRMNWIFKQGS